MLEFLPVATNAYSAEIASTSTAYKNGMSGGLAGGNNDMPRLILSYFVIFLSSFNLLNKFLDIYMTIAFVVD